jgi:hypothetical protein
MERYNTDLKTEERNKEKLNKSKNMKFQFVNFANFVIL